MSSSGPEKQQWGRRLFACGGVLLLLGVLTLFYRPLSDMAWDVKHHFTATDGSASVELPWGWRQDETKGSEHRIVLSNSLREVFRFRAPDEITLRDLKTRFDAVEMAQEWERFEIRRMIPGDRLEPTPKNGFLRTNYRCADIKRSADRQICPGLCRVRRTRRRHGDGALPARAASRFPFAGRVQGPAPGSRLCSDGD